MIANASQVRIPCESPVPSRPVPSLSIYPSIDSYLPRNTGHDPAAAVVVHPAMDDKQATARGVF